MGLKEFYYKIEDRYYAFINWLAANGLDLRPLISVIESHGVPSLPLFTAIILIAAGGIYLHFNPDGLQGFGLGGGSSLVIKVQSAAGPVDGALVSLAGDGVSQSGSTVNGEAAFYGIENGKRLRVSVSKEGFQTVTRDVVTGSAIGPFLLQGGREQVTVLVVDSDGSPVSSAQVSYTVEGEARNTLGDARGIARLSVSVGSSVSLTVTAQGFDIHRETFTVDSPGYQHQVTLEPSEGRIGNFDSLARHSRDVPSPNDDEETDNSRTVSLAGRTSVEVTVVGPQGNGVEGASLTLFNQVDSSVISHVESATDTAGKFTFTGVSTGIRAYVGVDADGYIAKSSQPKLINSGVAFTVSLQNTSDASAANLSLSFTDDSDRRIALSALKIFLVDAGTHSVIGSGQLEIDRGNATGLPSGKSVYLSISSRSYVRFASEPFTLEPGGNEFTGALVKITEENSATATVNVVDFYTDPVQATVTLALSSNSHLLLPELKTGAGGVAEISGLPRERISLSVSNGTFFGVGSIDLTEGNGNAVVQILPVVGTVKLKAVDLSTGTYVEGAKFFVYYRRGRELMPIASCPPVEIRDGFCTLSLASGITYTLVASAAGYLNKTQSFVLAPSQTSEVEVAMISTADNQVMSQRRFSILEKTPAGPVPLPEGASLEEGKVYFASFDLVVPAHSRELGFYLRVDSPLTSANDNAMLLKGFPLDDPYSINSGEFSLSGSGSFSPTSCGQAIASDAVGTFKWIEAVLPQDKFEGVGLEVDSEVDSSLNLKMPFLVTRSKPRNVTMAFRGYSVIGSSYVRSPVDGVLGESREANGRKSCAASTFALNYSIVAASSTIVKCGAQACLFLSFEQDNRKGGEGFEVKPAVRGDALPSPLSMRYSVLDFNPNVEDGTELTFTTDRNLISILRKQDQLPVDPAGVEYGVSLADNTYKAVVKTPVRVKGSIKSNPSIQRKTPHAVTLSFGSKVAIATEINLVGLPEPSAVFAPLPKHYTLEYSGGGAAGFDSLKLLSVNNGVASEVEKIDFLVDPIMPADAVLLVFNFTSAPCQQLTFTLADDSACFEQVQNPRQELQLPEEYATYGDKLLMLKYDASSDRCSTYSKNPNVLKEATAKLRVASTCTSTARELTLSAKPNSALLAGGNFKDSYRAVYSVPSAWSEEGVAQFGVDSSYLHILINNRQYSRDNSVRVFEGSDEATASDFRVGDNAVVLPVRGMRAFASLDEGFLSNLLGVGTAPELLSVASSAKFENPAESMPSTREEMLSVLANTVFRRRQDCTPPRPCPFGMFPYSAFVRDAVSKPVQLHLGGELWAGSTGNGKVDFEFAGLRGETCSDRNEEGVYDYYWEYSVRPEDGNALQVANFKPIQLDVLDYADSTCSRSQQLCGKLSFNGGQCLNNCGDGWYNGATPGLQGKLCSGNQFKLDDIRPRGAGGLWKGWLQNIPSATLGCFVTEVAGSIAGCEAGSVGGPIGRVIGTQAGGQVAGLGYDLILGDTIAHETASLFNLKRKKGDLPGFTNTLNKWAQYCSYAGIAVDAVNAYQIIKEAAGATTVAETRCPGLSLAAERAAAKCMCLNSGGIQDAALFDLPGGCFVEKALRTLVTDTAVVDAEHTLTGQFARADTAFADYADAQARAATALESLRSASTSVQNQPAFIRQNEILQARQAEREIAREERDAMIAELRASGFCKDQNSQQCRESIKKANEQIGILDSGYELACGKAFIAATALLAVEGVAAEAYADERAYIQINREGNTKFGGGTLGIGSGPDVDCEDNTDFRRNADAWLDFDFSSLRVFEGKATRCMDKRNIATYGKEGEVSFDRDLATFYITSRR